MYQSFYQKYRPQKFSEIIGQEEIITILKSSIIKQRIHHAYLFNGMHGTGKTSTARIMAKAINCQNNQLGEPCTKCKNCQKFPNVDIIEIDGASNNGVEQIRTLKEIAFVSPLQSKYKVYIIDEVHMLTKAAFNAFLKILEEPPKHVIFIMATTEMYKIIPTILSRCQNFHFLKLDDQKLQLLLKKIAFQERLNFTDQSLKLIAFYSNGSVRDALNTLEQISLSNNQEKIDQEKILNHFGFLSEKEHRDFIHYLLKNDRQMIKKYQEKFFKNNLNYKNLTEQILMIFKDYFFQEVDQQNNQWQKEKWQKIVNLILNFIPNFNYQISSKLVFEIMCLNILQIIESKDQKEQQEQENQSLKITNFQNIDDDKIITILHQRNHQIFQKIKTNWHYWKKFELHSKWEKISSCIVNGKILTSSNKEVVLVFPTQKECDFINQHQQEIVSSNLSKQLFGLKLVFYAITQNKAQVIKEKFHKEKNQK